MISLLEAMSLGHTYADEHGREVMADQEIAATRRPRVPQNRYVKQRSGRGPSA